LEIDLQGDPDGIQTVDDKRFKPMNKICPANIPDELAEKIMKECIRAFKALDLRDFSRVDIRLDEDDNIYLIEINSMASLGLTGSYSTAAKVAGYSYEKLVNRMLDVAVVRYFSNTMLTNIPDVNKKGKVSFPARIRSFLKSRQQQTEKLLKNLVDFNSHIRNIEGVNRCSNLIASELSQLGFTQEVFPQLEVGNITYLSNSFDQSIDYLILLQVDNNIKLASQENFSEGEQFLKGAGIWTSKGGAAIVISALQALRFARRLKKVNLGILLIPDSTIDGKYSKSIIQQKANLAETTLAFSGSTKEGGIVLSRSGSAAYRYEVKLIKKDEPENVSLTAMHFNKTLASITDISKNDPENVIAPYDIQFTSNIFKDYAHGSAGISVRYNSIETLDDIEKKIKKIISPQKRSKVFQVHFEGGQKRPAMMKSEVNVNFFKRIKNLAKSIDVRISEEHRWSSSDICHIMKDQPKIDGMGPVGEYLPHNNERILKHSIIERSLLLALLLNDA
jgi:D-alanine-D-alanine ligase